MKASNNLQRRSSFGGILELSQLYRSSLRLCGPVIEWGFIEILQGRNLVRLSKRREDVFFGLRLSLIKGKRSPFKHGLEY
jgi:hypothetical protein